MALHEGGRDEYGLRRRCRVAFADDSEEIDGGGAAHVIKRLAHGGEAGADCGGGGNVVKADNRDIAGDVESCFVERGDGAHGRDIVEGKDGGEWLAACNEGACGLMTRFGAGLDAFELHDEPGVNGDAEFGADFADGIPADCGVRTEALALDEGDAAVAERGEMVEGVARGGEVVEFDGDDAFAVFVAGDGDDGNLKVVHDGRVDGDDAFDRTGEQQTRVAFEEIGAMTMTDDEVEVFFLQESVFHAAEYGGCVAFADFWNHDADGEAAFVAKLTCDGVRFVIEERGGLEDTLLGFRGDAVLVTGSVHDAGDGALG